MVRLPRLRLTEEVNTMDWNLSEDHKIIKETVSKIAQKELVPKAAEIDKTGSFVWEGLKKLKEADVLGLATPSEYGGMGMDILSFVLATEEIAKACASTSLSFVSHSICSHIILSFGKDGQKKKHLPSMAKGERLGAFCVHESNCGSNALALETKAVLEGNDYIVSGSKIIISF